jgi:hypothetical protein
MPRKLPTKDADAHDYVQFRGAQTSVIHDPTGIRFGTEERADRVGHEAHPVVDDGADADDVPDDAIAASVAAELVAANPLICYGVACETCGDVFDTPRALNSHQSAHADDDPDDGGDVDDDTEDDRNGGSDPDDDETDSGSNGDRDGDGADDGGDGDVTDADVAPDVGDGGGVDGGTDGSAAGSAPGDDVDSGGDAGE